MRKPIGTTLISLFGILAIAASCATTKTQLASAPPPIPAPATAPAPTAPPAPVSVPQPAPAKAAPAGPSKAQTQSGGLHVNAAGLAIIKSSEGVHLTAYNSTGQWLIGYGHAKGVKAGMTIGVAQAEAYLKEDLAVCEDAVNDAVQAPITRNQFSAMVSLCYNIGMGSFKSSSLVKHLNAGEEQAAADAFLDWSKAKIKGERIVLAPLLERRQKERALFLDGMTAPRA